MAGPDTVVEERRIQRDLAYACPPGPLPARLAEGSVPWLHRPGQIEQYHGLLGWEDPVGQQPLRGAKTHRPAGITNAAPAKDHAGFGRVHPKDRDNASERAGQQGRCAAKPLVDELGDQNLVGGRSTTCFGLVPGQQLGALALADPFDQGVPVGELLR